MENNILMYTMLFFRQLISASLILAITTSMFVKNRKKGFVLLTLYIIQSIYSLNIGFKFSILMGSGMLIIYIGLGLLTYFVIKKKLSQETAI